MIDALIIALFGFVFLVLARVLGLGRLVKPGIGGLYGWRREGWPRGLQEEDPNRPWGRGERGAEPARDETERPG